MISIIIPIYNGEKYIRRCIQSIISQSYQNLEIIIVDDGSEDNTSKIVKSLSLKHNNIKYYYKKNSGVSSARNYGLTKANGEFVTFVDCDDKIEHTLYEKVIDIFKKYKTDIVAFNYNIINKDGSKLLGINKEPSKSFQYSILQNDEIMGFVFNKVYKKYVIDEIKFDENIKIYEDLLYNVKVSLNANTYYYIDEPLYNYYQNEDSAMHTIYKKDITRFYAYEKINNMIENKSLLFKRLYYFLWDYQKYSIINGKINDSYLEKIYFKYLKYLLKHSKKITMIVKLILLNYFPNIFFKLKKEV